MQKSGKQKPLMDYALYLLGRKRYTVAEMQKKLSARLIKIADPESIEKIPAVIARLRELNLLNDKEFAELFIRDQLQRKPQGLMLLKQNMTQKGIEKELINEAINNFITAADHNNPIDTNNSTDRSNPSDRTTKEFTLARLAAVKKLKTLTKIPPQKQREKLVRFLFSRGFSPSIAIKVVNSKLGEMEEDV